MRIFIALQFEEPFRQALLDVQSVLKNCGIKGNYTKPENLHLTLAFIGEYGNPQDILDALDDIEFTPFELSLNEIGRFETILWAGLVISRRPFQICLTFEKSTTPLQATGHQVCNAAQ